MTDFRLAALVGAALFAAAPAAAQPSNQELDQRMQRLERSVDTILDLLQGNRAPAAQPAAASSAAPAPTGIRWGMLHMDVHTRAMNQQEIDAANRDPSALPAGPDDFPAGSVPVRAGATFNLGAFTEDASLARLRNAQANVQVHWNGVLRIDAQGQHAFVLELSKAEGFGIGNCRGVLRLNDQIVIDNGINFRFRGPNVQSSLIQGARNLAPGAYDFSLFVTCVRDNNDAFGLVTASLAMAGPGDRVPRPIAADRLGVRE